MSLALNSARIRFSTPLLSQKSMRFRCLRAITDLSALLLVISLVNSSYASSLVDQPTAINPGYCSGDSVLGQAVVQIQQGGKFSTGVIVGKNRLLTVAHAVNWDQALPVFASVGGELVLAQPLLVYKESDLALFELETKSTKPLPIADRELLPQEHVWTSGFPLGQARTIENGTVSSVREKSIVTSATVFPGVSGGSLVRCDVNTGTYELAGIVTAYVATVDGEEITNTGHSVSLRLRHIKRLMESSKRLVRTTDRFGDVVPDRLIGKF